MENIEKLDSGNLNFFDIDLISHAKLLFKFCRSITGKGLRSKNLNDPYQSKNLSILKYSVPNFIKGNNQLMSKIINIDFDAVENPSIGNFNIFLKRKK